MKIAVAGSGICRALPRLAVGSGGHEVVPHEAGAHHGGHYYRGCNFQWRTRGGASVDTTADTANFPWIIP